MRPASTPRSLRPTTTRSRAEQAQRRADGDPVALGIGVSIYVEITGGVPPFGEVARVVVNDDGSATVYSGTSSHGQGHQTAWSMIAASELGIPMEQITVIQNDTDLVPVGGGTMGSRSLQHGGAAVLHTSKLMADTAKQHAADVLEAAAADVVLDIDRRSVPRRRHAGEDRDVGRGGRRRPCGRRTARHRRDLERRLADVSRSGRTSPSSRSTPRPAA